MNVIFKKLQAEAHIPAYAHPGDAGMDVYTCETKTLEPGERYAYRTGVAVEIPEGYVGLVWDRSSRATKSGLKTMAGVIDSGYRGEVKIVLLNTSTTPVEIAAGDKIAQLLMQPVERATIIEGETLSETQRGIGGFGSTGN